jgi:hypothetical protein
MDGMTPEVLPLARREAGLDRQAGLRTLERALDPACIPFPRRFTQWVPDLAVRVMKLDSTTVAGAAPEFDRLPNYSPLP